MTTKTFIISGASDRPTLIANRRYSMVTIEFWRATVGTFQSVALSDALDDAFSGKIGEISDENMVVTFAVDRHDEDIMMVTASDPKFVYTDGIPVENLASLRDWLRS